jgi:P4 family phage/plasmid primase-like protien
MIKNDTDRHKWFEFLKAHSINDSSDMTNTRIPGGDGLPGGKYKIESDNDYKLFLELHQAFILSGNKEHMTEKQRSCGPILIDIDLRLEANQTTRLYGASHLDDLCNIYLDELKTIYQFNSETNFNIYIFEKPSPILDAKKQVMKDGIHIIIGILAEREIHERLRKAVLPEIENAWSNIPIVNTWDAVVDNSIARGSTNWQVFGSCKPTSPIPYEWTYYYKVSFDEVDCEFSMTRMDIPQMPLSCDQLFEISARCTTHPTIPYKSSITSTLNNSVLRVSQRDSTATSTSSATASSSPLMEAILQIHTIDELRELYETFKSTINQKNYELLETCQYTMMLPDKYYTDYTNWIKVGWALCNIDYSLFILWMMFSSQWSKFSIMDIREHYDRWVKFNMCESNGLTRRSIMYWAKMDNYEEYIKVRKSSVEYFINESLKYPKCAEVDIADILYEFYKDQFVCAGIRGSAWYQYEKHRWKVNECGTSLRKNISGELRDLYKEILERKTKQLMLTKKSLEATKGEIKAASASLATAACLDAESKRINEEIETQNKFCDKLQEVIKMLGQTSTKDHIMMEAKEKFYDELFMQRLDENPFVLCFNNGVFDFRVNEFRMGRPEDYISKTTKNNYIPSNQFTIEQSKIAKDITTFIEQLFPIPELCNYMWQHLASTLLGNSAVQTFNMYTGQGQNGKSVLTKLMGLVLGEYKGDVPLSIITEKRVQVGGVSPEIVNLKGIRYAVMQEPSKGQRMNEGMMKQLTSGQDVLTGRAPFMTNVINFIPQFKLVVCCNELIDIRSQDYGTWRRIRVVDFLSLFTENPKEGDIEKPYQFKIDVDLDKKFIEWKEIFLSMLVDIAKVKQGRVDDCPRVLGSSNDYRNDLDYISTFMDEYVIVEQTGRVTKKDLNYTFTKWFSQLYGDKGCPNIKELYGRFNSKYGKTMTNQPWKGIKLRCEEESLEDADDCLIDL